MSQNVYDTKRICHTCDIFGQIRDTCDIFGRIRHILQPNMGHTM